MMVDSPDILLQAPLLLWVAAVMVIYGVSYSNLQGLQGPLASLVSVLLHGFPCLVLDLPKAAAQPLDCFADCSPQDTVGCSCSHHHYMQPHYS
jgi:hypothetical protein